MDGQNNYFKCVFEKYARLVKFVAFAILESNDGAEDVVSETFVRFMERAKDKPVRNEKAYLCAVASRLAIKEKRAQEEKGELSEFAAIDNTYQFLPLKSDLAAAMASLSEIERKTVALRVVCEMSYRDISKALGGTPLSSQSRYRRAIKKLKDYLGDDYEKE